MPNPNPNPTPSPGQPLPPGSPAKPAKPEKPDERPPHARLFEWKGTGPYRWKENFPVQPVLRPRHRLATREGALPSGALPDGPLPGGAEGGVEEPGPGREPQA